MALRGRVIVVTGGCSGVGKAFGLFVLQQEARLAFIDFNENLGCPLEKEWKNKFGEERVMFLSVDVSNLELLQYAFGKVVKEWGALDIVLNNAGVATPQLESVLDRRWVDVLRTNLEGVIQGTQCAIFYFENLKRGGIVINMAAMVGCMDMPCDPVYAASMAGVIQYSRSLMNLAKSKNILVHAVCPGFVHTRFLERACEENKGWEQETKDKGVMSVDTVVEGLYKLIADPKIAPGTDLMYMTPQHGVGFFHYEPDKILPPIPLAPNVNATPTTSPSLQTPQQKAQE